MPSRTPVDSSLHASLVKSLSSRASRQILRRLPVPSDPPSPSTTSDQPLDFSTNDYLSLSASQALRDHFLATLSASPHILGSGGSRLLVNPTSHDRLEERLARFFGAECALLWNSGFDANVGLFGCLPRGPGKSEEGDWVVYDEYVHASVWDGMRAWEGRNADLTTSSSKKSRCIPFRHNDMSSLRHVLTSILSSERSVREGSSAVFIAIESLYSMDGTVAPLRVITDMLDELFGGRATDVANHRGRSRQPRREAYLIVDEAHATGIYGPQGRGLVAMEGLEQSPWILARLVTFGKALAASGAVLLTNNLIRDYLINYARPIIYTTALSNANIIAASCSFDMLENGLAGQLSSHLLALSTYFLGLMHATIKDKNIPPHLLCLPSHLATRPTLLPCSSSDHPWVPPPTPILPLLTPHPRPLASYLLTQHHITVKPITHPTVPKGKERIRVCLRAGMEKQDVERLVGGIVAWIDSVKKELDVQRSKNVHRDMVDGSASRGDRALLTMRAKL